MSEFTDSLDEIVDETMDEPFAMPEGALVFVPLGGAGEIGMNMTLYGYNGKWLMVDMGISFPDETMPGIEVIMADPKFIMQHKKDLAGLVITHAHEDHIGAVGYLWHLLECPVYVTPFAGEVLKAKLAEKQLTGRVPVHVVPLGGKADIGPFSVEFLTITHSIPEPASLAIRTPAGTVLHTGDWKLDPAPTEGPVADEAAFRRVGNEGVTALVCDSTNAMVPGDSGSESEVMAYMTDLFPTLDQRIVVTCFATNVGRLASIAAAAKACGRDVALVGRSLWRIYDAAKATGYLEDVAPFLSEHDEGFVPRDKIVLICTGSQGEPRSALSRISSDDHPEVSLEAGDVVIFSSREIPGNEKAIFKVQNRLVARGIRLITHYDGRVHVSGHPSQDELRQMYQWIRPEKAVPVHGETLHLHAHANLARSMGVKDVQIPENGTVLQLAPGPVTVLDHVSVGRLGLDGTALISLGGTGVRSRTKMMQNGAAMAVLIMNNAGELVVAPRVTVMGIEDASEDSDSVVDAIVAVQDSVSKLPRDVRCTDDHAVRETARIAVRRSFSKSCGKKPLTEVQLVRL